MNGVLIYYSIGLMCALWIICNSDKDTREGLLNDIEKQKLLGYPAYLVNLFIKIPIVSPFAIIFSFIKVLF
jgi:hypothetical protein